MTARHGDLAGPPVGPAARFDDMVRRTSTVLGDFVGEVRAGSIDGVVGALAEAEEAARRGLWAAGFVTYDAAPAFDAGLRVPGGAVTPDLPLAWFGLYRRCERGPLALPASRGARAAPWSVATPREEYVLRVKAILDEIDAGNVYQVNLTSPVTTRRAGDPATLYRRLLQTQQPAYGALIELGDVAIASASPELFFEWDGATLTSRPMKGTARRGRWAAEDAAAAAGLAGSAKERAENVMIVDLIRNDMGKVARVGSVAVRDLWRTEAYPNVWQMVSQVTCATRPEVGLVDVFRAMFPCGSVTGAPKHRAMQVIAGLETDARGVYCGAVGLLAPRAGAVSARFNVAIRTAVLGRAGAGRFGSGGGVVAASRPEGEHAELVLKAAMLTSALGQRFRLLETFRFSPEGANENLAAHLARLRASAAFLGFAVPPALERRLERRLGAPGGDVKVRLLLSRSGRAEIQVSEAPEAASAPVRLALDHEPVSSQWALLFHKSTQRGLYERRRVRHRDADDIVMVNERGECTEVTTANLAVRVGARWVTPPLSSGCLPGVERARLLEAGVLTEAVVTPQDLAAADELAVVNSLRGWRAAVLIQRGA
jgi:para-aminobenzoate synthetase / 4-amino-4-deoxychorismate lyase